MTSNKNSTTSRSKRIAILILKTILWIIAIPVSLIVICFVALQFEGIQKLVTSQATNYLSKKIHSKVQLEKITIVFPKSISLTNLYVEDQKKDTLLYSHFIEVDLNLLDLFSKKIVLNDVKLETVTGHILRETANGKFNFSFIPEAFSSKQKDKTKQTTDTNSTWQFSIEELNLKSIYFSYHDRSSGMNADLVLGKFETSFDKFDLNKDIIHINTIALKNTKGSITQNEPLFHSVDSSASQPFIFDLDAKKIMFDSIKATYNNTTNGQNLNMALGKFSLDIKKIDLKNEKIELENLILQESELRYTQNKRLIKKSIQTNLVEKESTANWTITLNNLDFENNALAYNNSQTAPVKNAMDFNHLLATQLNIKGKNIYINAKKSHLDLNELSFQEQNGFQVKALKAKIIYDSTHIDLSGLHLQTGNSSINDHLSIRYSSLEQLSDSIQKAYLNCSFENTSIAAKDLLYFAPALADKLKNTKSETVQLAGKINGTLNNLVVSKFEVHTLQNTSLKITGSVKNVTDLKNMYASASFEITSTKKELQTIIPDALLPKNIELPEAFCLKGNYTGYIKNFNADLNLKSSIGAFQADIKMNPTAGNKEQRYDAKVDLDDFDLGKLLKQTGTLGAVTLTAAIKGSGFDTSNFNTTLDLGIKKAVIKNYAYSNFSLKGTVLKKSFSGQASMNDENLAFDFNGAIDLEPAQPKYTFTLNLAGVDLKGLGFSKEDLRLSMLVQSDIVSVPGQNVTGKASIKNGLLIRNSHKYPLDSLILTSDRKDGISDIHLRSEIFTADMNGTIVLNQLTESITNQLNSYFNFEQTNEKLTHLKKQDFKFEFDLNDPTLITGNLLPKMQKLTPFNMKGSYSSENKDLKVAMNIPQIQYDSITVDSLKLNITSDPTKLNYALKIAQLSNPTLKFENLFLGGDLQNNALSFQFNTAKDDSAKLLAIGGILKSIDHEFDLKLNSGLIINAQKWAIDNSNEIHFSKKGLYANNVTISNEGQSLSLNSKEKNASAPLEIIFKNFDITTISHLIENKKDLANGFVNGTITLEKQNGASAFRSDIEIKDFKFQTVPVGVIKLKADNFEDLNKYDVALQVEGGGNDITMKGYYLANKNSDLNFELAINHLNLSTVEPFTFNQVTRMSGSVNGKLAIKGTTALPIIDGVISFNDAAFRPRLLNSYLTVPNSKLSIDSRKIHLNNFTLNDSFKHNAVVDGTIDLNDLKKINLDLHVKTDNFLALNTKRKDNPLYYGTIMIDSDIRVKGTTDAPIVTAQLKLNKGTNVTYVKPEDQITKNESKGIVEFINKHPDKNIAIMIRQNDSINGISGTKGIDLSASIDIDRSVKLKMIVDPSTGDSLFMRGGGLLDFHLDPSGKTSLSGKYRINDGGYYLALQGVVKRNFSIQKGSTVTWSGDVLDAYVDLTAIYNIKTSPLDLVSDELNGVDDMERNKYRNLLNFQVFLKMSGFISSPQISFDIQLSPEDRGALNGAINSQLGQLREDESQLNKQVFALLTLGRFVGENPLESSSDGGLSSASRSSASKVLTQELNNLSNKVSFIDLDLGLNSFEDYSTGQEEGRTQLQVGVSKKLFKDKVTVRVGGNVDLEGERATQNDVNDVAGNVNVDYKLTSDGRYKLKGFRENQYENPIEGELIKTGAGVVYIRNFNSLRQLFSKPPKLPEKQKQKNADDDEDDDK